MNEFSKKSIKKILIYTLYDGTKIYCVNGNEVRDVYDEDFLKGGHGYAYKYIPKDEIWVEIDVIIDNEPELLGHEIIEYYDMKADDSMSYEEAHSHAESVEEALRIINKLHKDLASH